MENRDKLACTSSVPLKWKPPPPHHFKMNIALGELWDCYYRQQWSRYGGLQRLASSLGDQLLMAAYLSLKALNFSQDIRILDLVDGYRVCKQLLALFHSKEPCPLEISDLVEPIRSFCCIDQYSSIVEFNWGIKRLILSEIKSAYEGDFIYVDQFFWKVTIENFMKGVCCSIVASRKHSGSIQLVTHLTRVLNLTSPKIMVNYQCNKANNN